MEGYSAVLKPAELRELMDRTPGVRLLDVRTPAEYESVHIRGTYNVPLDSLGEHASEIRAVDEPVVLLCQSGTRARKAEEALKAAGMPNLHVLDGGVNGWITAGQPVLRGRERLSLERQVRIIAGAMAALGGILAVAVDPLFALLSAGVGSGLIYAGLTDRCGLALACSRLPYNRPASCDVEAMVRALRAGTEPITGGSTAVVSSGTRACA